MAVASLDPTAPLPFEPEISSYFVRGLTTNGYPDYRWEHDFVLQHIPKPPRTVLDAGGGTGVLQVWLSKHGYSVTNVDASPGILAKVAAINRRFGTTIKAVHADLSAIPLETNTFDVVVSVSSLEHNKPDHFLRVWKELVRVSKVGGTLTVTMPVAAIDKERWDARMHPLWRWDAETLYRAVTTQNISGLAGLHTDKQTADRLAEVYSPNRKIYPVGFAVRKRQPTDEGMALALFGFARPDYLKRAVRSIETNANRSEVDFYYIQDGGANNKTHKRWAPEKTIAECLSIVRGSKVGFRCIEAPGNRGIPVQQMEAMCYLFRERKYSTAVCLVDDFEVSRYFLDAAKTLCQQFRDDPRVFAVQHGHINHMSVEEKRKVLDRYVLRGTMPSPGGWTLFREKWLSLLPFYAPYYDLIKDAEYRDRDHKAISALLCGNKVTSHDAGYEWALARTAMRTVWPLVNRCVNIGEMGTHMRPPIHGPFLRRTVLHEFPEDQEIKAFVEHKGRYDIPSRL